MYLIINCGLMVFSCFFQHVDICNSIPLRSGSAFSSTARGNCISPFPRSLHSVISKEMGKQFLQLWRLQEGLGAIAPSSSSMPFSGSTQSIICFLQVSLRICPSLILGPFVKVVHSSVWWLGFLMVWNLKFGRVKTMRSPKMLFFPEWWFSNPMGLAITNLNLISMHLQQKSMYICKNPTHLYIYIY